MRHDFVQEDRQGCFERVGEVFSKQSVGDRAFIDAILRNEPVAPSLYDGFKAQEGMDAAIASCVERAERKRP